MLLPMSELAVLREWDAIRLVVGKAIERDPGRSWMDVLGQALGGQIEFWRDGRGYVALRKEGPVLWVVYAGGRAGTIGAMRGVMNEIETRAVAAGCREVRFEGRDWRRVFPGYVARRDKDGRWHFRKALR